MQPLNNNDILLIQYHNNSSLYDYSNIILLYTFAMSIRKLVVLFQRNIFAFQFFFICTLAVKEQNVITYLRTHNTMHIVLLEIYDL